MAPIWGLKWLPKRAFEVRLAIGPSKNECLGLVFENIRILMNFLCESDKKKRRILGVKNIEIIVRF